MTTKGELLNWQEGVEAYEAGDLLKALGHFKAVGNFAKVIFNIGMIYCIKKDFNSGEIMFNQAVQCDKHFAVAHFHKGYALFMLGEYDLAEESFKTTYDVIIF
jgi:tetratricopeptide (TPR) repeat protein